MSTMTQSEYIATLERRIAALEAQVHMLAQQIAARPVAPMPAPLWQPFPGAPWPSPYVITCGVAA